MRRWGRLALVAAVLAAPRAHAVARTWTGAVNTQWNNAGNWSPAGTPTTADDLTVNTAATIRNTNGASAVAGSLSIGAAVTILRNGNRTLTVTNAVTVATTSNVVLNIPFTSASLSKSGSGSLSLGFADTVSGAVSVTGGTLALARTSSLTAGSFSLAAGSTLSVNFSGGGNTVTTVTTAGNATLAGVLSITGANPALGRSPFTIVTSTGGTVDITGLTLGTAPTGFAFGFRTVGNTFVLDVARQPIAVDGTGGATGTCGASLTWQHTVSGTANDRYLLVGVSTGNAGGSVAPTSVTYGAQTLGLLASATNGGSSSSRAFIYGLLAPARGSAAVTVNLPAGPCSAVGGSVSYTGVNQANPTRAAGTAGGTGTAASVTVATGQGDKVISVVSSNTATSGTPQSGATVRWSANSGAEFGGGSTIPDTGASTTMSWTLAPPSSNEWALAAVPIRAVNPTGAEEESPVVRFSAQGAAISFRAGPASDLVGFRVWRESGGRRELLTPGLIAGPVLTSRATLLAGSELGWLDARPTPGAQYWVESIHLDGGTDWTRAATVSGRAPLFASAVLGPGASVLREQPSLRIGAADPLPIPTVPTSSDAQRGLAAAPAVKLVVSQPGVLSVSAEALFAAGLPVGTPATSIKLYRQGRPVPRTVLAADRATLRPGDSVEFYGHGMDTRYSGSAVYWLTAGPGAGLELATTAPSPIEVGATTFLAAAEIRERLTWFGAVRNGDAEKFFGPAVYSQARDRTLPLDGLDMSATGARLEVALQGVTQVPHAVNLTVNGLPVGTLAFAGQELGATSIELPPGALVPGDNVVGLVAPAASDISLEQYVRLVYPRHTARVSGALELTLPGGSATLLDGFDPALTRVLDVTSPDSPVRLAVSNASGSAAVTAPGDGVRRLVAYLPGDAAAPASVVANHPSSWHSAAGADLVIVGPSSLFPGIEPLAERRRSEGLTVALVDVEDVQDEFAGGEKSAEALRAFLAQALQSWSTPPRWVLLLGSATYDPRDYLGLGGDLVPSGIVQTDALEAASDGWFLDVPGAEAVSIGRLPVRTLDETQAVVGKILGRSEADARSPVLLVSDVLGTSDFPEMTADLRADLPDAAATVLVRGSQSDDVLHQEILDAARAGPALVNYVGHGAETFWSGNVHTVDDAAALAGGRTSLWVHMTCLAGFFQDPRRQSLAVATLLSPSGGAWGAWGSTSMTYPSEHPMLDRALVKALLLEGKTLGEATREALAGTSDPDLKSTFVLLGDPSARAVAQASSALTVTTKSSGPPGCSSPGAGTWNFAVLLALVLWLAASRRRDRVVSRRRR